MRIPGRALLTACTLTLAIGCLTACTSTHTAAQPSSKPSSTPTPIFTSDAEALAAATTVYKKYLDVSSTISRDGGVHPERIDAVASGNARELAHKNAGELEQASLHFTGQLASTGYRLQQWKADASGLSVVFYACEDLTKVDLVDANGKSVSSRTREIYSPYQVTVSGKSIGQLVVSNLSEWGGGGVCPA